MDVGAPLVTERKAAEAAEPSQGPSYNPAMPAQPLADLDTSSCDGDRWAWRASTAATSERRPTARLRSRSRWRAAKCRSAWGCACSCQGSGPGTRSGVLALGCPRRSPGGPNGRSLWTRSITSKRRRRARGGAVRCRVRQAGRLLAEPPGPRSHLGVGHPASPDGLTS